MNRAIVKRLVLNDLYLFRWLIAGSIGAGTVSLVLCTMGDAGFFVGMLSYITTVVSMGVLLVMFGIWQERNENTWVFLLSLPVSALELASAKVVSNGVSFLVMWLALLVLSVAFVAWTPLANGLIPALVATLVLAALYYAVMLGVALCTTSGLWISVTIITNNIVLSLAIYLMNRMPAIAATLEGEVAVWSPEILGVIAAEAAAIGFVLWATRLAYARKREFV